MMQNRTLAEMHTASPPAPQRIPYCGRWPVMTVTTSFGTSTFEFAWSSFDVWPELLGKDASREAGK